MVKLIFYKNPWSFKVCSCVVFKTVFKIVSSVSFSASTLPILASSFLRVFGQNPGSSSKTFFFMCLFRRLRLNVMAKRCASSRIFCRSISSCEPFSNRILSFVFGAKTSSWRFAREQMLPKPLPPFRSHSTACDNCPFPPSIIIRCGKLFSVSPSFARRSITSFNDSKSSIFAFFSVFILYFRYLPFSDFPLTITDRDATVKLPSVCEIS